MPERLFLIGNPDPLLFFSRGKGDAMTERQWLTTVMTEDQWLKSRSYREMRDVVYCCMGRCGLLFAAACCRSVWHLLPDGPSRMTVLMAERQTPALFQERCAQAALARFWEEQQRGKRRRDARPARDAAAEAEEVGAV
jgi:hypothetical protein